MSQAIIKTHVKTVIYQYCVREGYVRKGGEFQNRSIVGWVI